MLGDLDLTKKVPKPQLFLCKPNRTTIGKLTFAYNINLTVNLGKVNELTFDLPYQVDVHHNFQREINIDNVRVQYLVKLVYNGLTDYFIIDKIDESMDSNGDKKSIHAFSLAYQLINKRIRNYQADSQTATQQLTTALAETTWTVGTVDPSFDAMYRGMDISSNTVLEVVYQIAETFQALVQFNSVSKTIDLLVPDNFGQDKGLNFKYGKYLKQLGNDIDTSSMVTSLKAYGKDDMTIGAVNPTGGDAIENLSYFLYPFERDANKNVISSSYYMSDSLCNAILDYEELSASYTDQYKSLLVQLTNAETTLTSKQTDLTNLQNQLAIINDNLDLQRSQKTLTIYNLTYKGSSITKTTTLDPTNDYVVMMSASSVSNLTVKLDGTTKTLSANTWTVLGKLSGKSTTSVALSGSNGNSTVSIYVLQISSDEYTTSGNNTDLLNKYNDKYEQSLIDAKQKEVNSAQSNVDSIQSQINTIVDTLSIEKNFTPEQIEERDAFIITYEWSDSNYIDAQSLYDAAVKQLQQLQSPPIAITIDIVNFLEVVESQREWDKLVLGDKVRISYDMFNLDVKAQIITIQYDFENSSIKLTIANVQEIKDAKQKFLDSLYAGASASKSVDMSKYKWDQGTIAKSSFDDFLANAMDATKQEIIAGVNETVTINRRGITITDSTNPNNIVVAQAGVIALSSDGGQNWRTALHADGIYSEELIGKIILGEVLQMVNSSGNMTFDDSGLTLSSTDNTKRILINESDGIKIQTSSDNGTTWKDQFYVNSSGQLITNGLSIYSQDGSDLLIDGTNKKIDFSKFTTIAGQLTAQNLVIGDGTNLVQINENSNPNGNTVVSVNSKNYFRLGTSQYTKISFAHFTNMDFKVGDQYFFGLYGYASASSLTAACYIRYYYTDGSWADAGSNTITLATTDGNANTYVRINNDVDHTKTLSYIDIFIQKNSSDSTYLYARNIEVRHMVGSALIQSITWDKGQGGTLTLGGQNNGNGELLVLDENGETIADLEATSGGFKTLSIGQIVSPSVYNASNTDQTINVSSNISGALHSIPPLNNGNCTLVFQNDISENIDISNYLGDGTIEINLNGHTLNGNIYIHGCSPQYVHIHDGTVNGDGNTITLNDAVVEIDRCTYVRLDNVKIYGNGNPSYGVYAHAGSGAYLASCEIYNVQEAISSATSARITCDTCKGLGTDRGLHAFYGGYIAAFGSQPGGTTSAVLASSGEVYPSGGTTVDTGAATPPTPPATTSSWKATSSGNWSSSGYWDSSPKQGNWGYGRRSGYWFFGSSPSTAVTGKTIQSMRIKVTRASTGGYSSDVGIVFRSHNYTSQPSGAPSPTSESSYSTTVNLAWGESTWISLPSSFFADFQSGTAKGIGIYVASDTQSNYAIMSGSATLEITYS